MNKRYQKKTNNMTRKEFDSLYLYKAVHCDTEEKANEFLALADSVGYKWFSDRRLIEENMWEEYEKETCYLVTDDEFMFCNIDHFTLNGYQIIEYTLPLKFKVGDRVRVKNAPDLPVNEKFGVIVDVIPSRPMIYSVKVGCDGSILWFYENQLEKANEQKAKVENTKTLIDEIKAKWSEINILLNRLEKKEKGE